MGGRGVASCWLGREGGGVAVAKGKAGAWAGQGGEGEEAEEEEEGALPPPPPLGSHRLPPPPHPTTPQEAFTERNAAHILKSLVLFLAHMHSRGIAHMDVKPEVEAGGRGKLGGGGGREAGSLEVWTTARGCRLPQFSLA